MHILHMLPLLTLLADPEPAWQRAAETDGITVYTRERKDSPVREMKAQGMVDAPPERVFKVVRDFDHYAQTMPSTETSYVISREDNGKVAYVYMLIRPPLISRRDFIIRAVDESDSKNGEGYFKSTWKVVSDKGPPPKPDIVRITINDGYWLLEPRDGGKKTLATYYLYTDPGGSVPKWIVNQANGTSVPDVFRAVRREAAKKE